MKISLRKANALQAAINDAISALDLSTDIRINEFENPSEKIGNAVVRLEQNLSRRSELLDALYEVRNLVAAANNISGINTLLADAARLDKDLSFNSRLAKLEPALSIDVIGGKIAKIKTRTDDYYGREDMVMTTVLDSAKLDAFKAKAALLKKEKVAVQDKLLELNVRTEIQIGADTVAILEKENIL
jgi:hypothetical protein